MKRKVITLFFSLAIVLVMTMAAQAASAAKQIPVNYQDITIYVNGESITVQPNEEPFIYDQRTFVPLRLVAEAVNLNVEWVDAAKAVKITGNNASSDSLAQKNQEIQDLKLQLAQKDTEIQNLESTIDSLQGDDDDVDEVISDLQSDLLSDFEDLDDVDIEDISLDGDEDDVEVDIEVDLSDYEDEWESLSDSYIEDWIEDLVYSIQDELYDDTVVDGSIIDTDSDDVLVKFNKDGEDSLEVDFYDEDYRGSSSSSDAEDVEDSLNGDSFYVDDLEFTISYINYDDDGIVRVVLDAYDNNASSEWDDLSSSTINSDVADIAENITDAFEDDADISLSMVNITFYDEDQDLLDSFVYDVDNAELD